MAKSPIAAAKKSLRAQKTSEALGTLRTHIAGQDPVVREKIASVAAKLRAVIEDDNSITQTALSLVMLELGARLEKQ